ncbi:MAG: TonB-dependent receptor, partial [Duncaniella sp.]|nr:TonB-dependent receptor [Duncaniella sp.]
RMKNLTLGYTLPEPVRKKLRLSNARVYLQGQNLFTITKYTGADPEGLGYPYAMPRQFTVGLQFGF